MVKFDQYFVYLNQDLYTNNLNLNKITKTKNLMKSLTAILALLGLATAQQEISYDDSDEHEFHYDEPEDEPDTYWEHYDTHDFKTTCNRVRIRNVESTQFLT